MQSPTAVSQASSEVLGAAQPFRYPLEREFIEPDWNRIPGYRGVSKQEWESALWQRRHTVKNLTELRRALQHWLPETLANSIERALVDLPAPSPTLSSIAWSTTCTMATPARGGRVGCGASCLLRCHT